GHHGITAHRPCRATGEPFEKPDLVQTVGHRDQCGKPNEHVPSLFVCEHTFHSTTRAITINESTNSATVVALISSPPKIQRPSASKASTAIDTSLKVMRPIFLSSSAAQAGTSGLLLSSGG